MENQKKSFGVRRQHRFFGACRLSRKCQVRRGSRGGEMGEFSPPLPPSLFIFRAPFFLHRPQILQPGFGSITLLQKFTPHFKILDPRLQVSLNNGISPQARRDEARSWRQCRLDHRFQTNTDGCGKWHCIPRIPEHTWETTNRICSFSEKFNLNNFSKPCFSKEFFSGTTRTVPRRDNATKARSIKDVLTLIFSENFTTERWWVSDARNIRK